MKTLRFWVLPNDGFRTAAGLGDLLRDFQRAHRDLRVEIRVHTAGQIWNDLLRGAKRPAEGERPDLVQIPHGWTAGLASWGVLQDLTELDPALSPEAWLPALREHVRLDGRGLYGVPWWAELGALLVRPAALRRSKSELSELGTWEGFVEACRRLAAGGQCVLGNAHPRLSFGISDLAPRIWARGGDILSRDGRRCVFQRSEGQKGTAEFLELWTERWMEPPGGGLSPGRIERGDCAMQFSLRLPPEGDGIVAVPQPGGPGLIAAQHLALPADGPRAKEAYELVKYLTDPRRQESYARALRALPALEGSFENALAGESAPIREAYRLAAARARALPANSLLGTLERVFDRLAGSLVRHVLRRSYRSEVLRQELVHAAAEMDYAFQLSLS